MKNKFDGLRGTLASIKTPYESDYSSDKTRYIKPSPLVLRDEYRHPRRTIVQFIDTLLLTPGTQGLDAAGELIGIPKFELPEGYVKSNMALLLKEQPDDFVEYALRDAEIAVRYGLRMRQFVTQELGLRRLPPTIGSIATAYFFKLMRDTHGTLNSKEVFLRDFGKEKTTKELYWHEGKQRLIEKKVTLLNDHRQLYEAHVAQCYHGGRNECYGFGPSAIHAINDFDLKGAYTTGMVDMPALDYASAYPTTDPKDFSGHVCGFAKVKFKFAATVRFPCLPVSTGAHGLYYPLSGISYCTAPELSLAQELGCDIEVEIGVIIPCKDDDRRVFEPFVQSIRDQRALHKKEGRKFEEQLIKETGNSLYGKTAQNLKEKTSFDPRTGGSKTTQCSELSNPYYAAHVTGFVRAVVSELMAKIPTHRTVYSVTTDGFLTDATLDELDCSGPLASRFKALAIRLDHSTKSATDVAVDAGNSLILECKHRVTQAVLMRTRGQLTGIPFPGENEVLLAKAGVKPPMKDKFEQNAYMVDLFVNRTPGQMVTQEHLISTRDQWKHETDLVGIQRQVRLSLDSPFA